MTDKYFHCFPGPKLLAINKMLGHSQYKNITISINHALCYCDRANQILQTDHNRCPLLFNDQIC